VNFGEFNKLCNSIVQKKYRKEKYTKLVSVPSLYKKSCEQMLQGLSVNSQNHNSDKQQLMAKLEIFIEREYKMQIQAYKI